MYHFKWVYNIISFNFCVFFKFFFLNFDKFLINYSLKLLCVLLFCIDSRVSSNYYLLKLYILDFFQGATNYSDILKSTQETCYYRWQTVFLCVFLKMVLLFFQNIQHDLWLFWLMFVINYTIYLIWYYFYLSIYSSVYLVSHLIFVFFFVSIL